MNSTGWLMVGLLVAGISACTTQDDESVAKDSADVSQNPLREQQKALQKARQAEQDIMDAYQRRDEEMEKQMH